MTFTPPKKPYQYPDRAIDCQASIDDAFQDLWDRSAAMGWGPEEIACRALRPHGTTGIVKYIDRFNPYETWEMVTD